MDGISLLTYRIQLVILSNIQPVGQCEHAALPDRLERADPTFRLAGGYA